ncbi:MAG: hypothetical protein VX421_12275 [Pseudomonadota bacterium]|nr:hypothetical protein [Pseudomonadota bacterium]
MPGKAFLIPVAILTTVIGTGYLLSAENRSEFQWLRSLAGSTPAPVPASSQPQTTSRPTQPTSPEPPSDNALGFMLASVAEQYEEASRYPDWSIPLSPSQARGYQGNHYEPVTLPLPGDGQFTVTLEKFRYTRGDTILVAASIQGSQVVANTMEATLETPQSRDAVVSTRLKEAGSPGYYEGLLTADAEPGEYRLIVEATVDGRPVRHASALTIEPDLGDFEGLGDPFVSNNNLVIPVNFAPKDPGFYALSAQLWAGQQPVAQLQAEKRLDGTSDVLELRAHGTVLANRNFSGQFQLKHLQIRQLPAKPGNRTHYAYGPDEGYTFTPPDLDRLTDRPAANPESEQRAALLRQLADKF